MTNQNREFDAEAAKKAHGIIIAKIEEIEQKQYTVGQGDLKFGPAFGLVASGQHGVAHQNYAVMHETAWQNIDATRRGLYAALAAIESSMEQNGITEYESVRELDDLNQEDPKELPRSRFRHLPGKPHAPRIEL